MSDMCEIIRSTLEAVKDFTDSDAIVGNVITTTSGVSLIPISKITVGFLGGGADYGQKRLSQSQSFGGGSGAGISISPIAFLSVSPDASVSIIPLSLDAKSGVDRISSIIERSPEIIDRIKKALS